MLGIGQYVGIVIAFNCLKSTQNLFFPFFFGIRMHGLLQADMHGSITPAANIFFISSFTNSLSAIDFLYGGRYIGVVFGFIVILNF